MKRVVSVSLHCALLGVLAAFAFHARAQDDEVDKLRREVERVGRAGEVGHTLAPRELPLLGGGSIDLGCFARPTLLLFFSPHCPACQAHAASWPALAQQLALDGIDLVAIAATRDDLPEFLARNALRMPVAIDADGSYAAEVGTRGVPERVLVGRGGVVQLREAAIAMLLAKRGGAAAAWSELADAERKQALLVLARSILPEVERVEEMPLRQGGDAVLVFEGGQRLLAFGRVLSSLVASPLTSDLECLLLVDPDGQPLGARPLRDMRRGATPVDAAELQRWLAPRPLRVQPADPLETAFVAGVNALRAELELPPSASGLVLHAGE